MSSTSSVAAESTKALLFLACAAALLLAAVFSHSNINPYARALTEARVRETVTLDGQIYEIANGQVMSETREEHGHLAFRASIIAYQKAAASRAPVLALPGVDLEYMRKALAELETASKELVIKNQGSGLHAEELGHLYPIKFLLSLADTEEARRAFIQTGSDRDALKYRLQEISTAREYIAAIRDFKKAFSSAVPEESSQFMTETRIVTRSDTLKLLEEIERSALEIQHQSWGSLMCGIGHFQGCRTDGLALDRIDVHAPDSSPASDLSDIRRILDDTFLNMNNVPTRTVTLADSSCIDSGKPQTFWLVPDYAPGAYAAPMIYAGDIRFVDGFAFPSVPFFKAYAERNVRYVLSTPLLHYQCMGVGNDLARIHTVAFIAQIASEARLSSFAKKHRTEFASLESRLSDPESITESDALEYLQLALDEIKLGNMSSPVGDKILDAYLRTRRQSGGIEYLIRYIAHIESSNVRLAEQGMPIEFDPEFLFMTRSAFPSFLFVTRSMLDDAFRQNDIPASQRPFVYYTSLNNIERNRAVADMKIYIQDHRHQGL